MSRLAGIFPLPQRGRGWTPRQRRPGEGARRDIAVRPLTPTLSPDGGEGVSSRLNAPA